MPAAKTTVRVRMYRQGLGDCHLLTVLEDGRPAFRMMIDCGVYQTTPGGADTIRRIVADVIAETGGHVDLLAVTHEHWDHVSGFNQARQSFATVGEAGTAGMLTAGKVWMGWTEDPDDPIARRIVSDRAEGVRRVAAAADAAGRLAAAGSEPARSLAAGLSGVLGFFGAGGRTTGDALNAARAMVAKPTYRRPDDPPVDLTSGVRAYTLGPPLDVAKLYLLLNDDETYGIAPVARAEAALAAAVDALEGGTMAGGQPFDPQHRVAAPFLQLGNPIEQDAPGDAASAAFLDRVYAGTDENGREQSWRRIDGDWLGASREFALRLDNATNNTSLVIVLELTGSGRTLVFAADAQVGSWLSWMDLYWDVGGRQMTGPDLLARAAFLKVGHHGSHNATLRAKGLETMSRDLIAFIPTDEAVAKKVGWGSMPLPALVQALEAHTSGRTVRADRDFAAGPDASATLAAFAQALMTTDLYYEIEIG